MSTPLYENLFSSEAWSLLRHFQCGICLGVLRDPHQWNTVCGHLFCRVCVAEAYKVKQDCPICRLPENVTRVPEVDRLIKSQLCRCPHQDCFWGQDQDSKCTVAALERHARYCVFRKITCCFCKSSVVVGKFCDHCEFDCPKSGFVKRKCEFCEAQVPAGRMCAHYEKECTREKKKKNNKPTHALAESPTEEPPFKRSQSSSGSALSSSLTSSRGSLESTTSLATAERTNLNF